MVTIYHRKQLYILFVVVCSAGFLYQAAEVSLEYFKYSTTTKVFLHMDNDFSNPSVVFCVRYTDILDRRDYKKYGINPSLSYDYKDWASDMSKLTIKDIFHLTPKADDVILGCQYRQHDYDLTSYNETQCRSLFRVVKYHEGRSICYVFNTQNSDDKFKCHRIARSFYSEGEMYSVTLKQHFLKSGWLQLISFIPGQVTDLFSHLPFASRRYFAPVVRLTGNKTSTLTNYYYLSGDVYSIQRLPYPYDTRCTRNYNESLYACRESCNIHAFKVHDLFPPNEISTNPIPKKHLSFIHIANQSFIKSERNENSCCSLKCTKHECNEWFSVTSAVGLEYTRLGSLTLGSCCSNRPYVAIHFVASISVWDYIIYISSSIGIWFGVSVFSLNPFKNRKSHSYNTMIMPVEMRNNLRMTRSARHRALNPSLIMNY